MNWVGLKYSTGNWLSPAWLEGLRVRAMRRRFCTTLNKLNRTTPLSLYLDLSVIACRDAGTGIQRFVRSVAMSLVNESPSDWKVVPIAANRKQVYQPISWQGQGVMPETLKALWQPGDVFLGLDFALDAIQLHRRQLMEMKQHGMSLWFVMYDLLPVQKPDWFSGKLVSRYQKWLRTISGLADGFFCISQVVADELDQYLSNRLKIVRLQMPELVVLPLGWDISHARHSAGVSSRVEILLHAMKDRSTALMVGTLEPRKGHADVLAAFECLWKSGHVSQLVIVGRPGWKTERLQQALRSHPLAGTRVFWLSNATDEEVENLYANCTGVIVASHAEGFGLPLLEALGHGKPVLARDIPVFHTLTSEGVSHFPSSLSSEELARNIEVWLKGIACNNRAIYVPKLPSWEDTSHQLLKTLRKGN